MPNLWNGKRKELDVLPLLRLGISNPYGPSSSANQLSEKGEETLGEISPRILEIVYCPIKQSSSVHRYHWLPGQFSDGHRQFPRCGLCYGLPFILLSEHNPLK
jgi:hypothetical protein